MEGNIKWRSFFWKKSAVSSVQYSVLTGLQTRTMYIDIQFVPTVYGVLPPDSPVFTYSCQCETSANGVMMQCTGLALN